MEKIKGTNETFKRKGLYVLISVFDGSEEVFVQKFNNIFDVISEIKFNNRFGFRSYLKYVKFRSYLEYVESFF